MNHTLLSMRVDYINMIFEERGYTKVLMLNYNPTRDTGRYYKLMTRNGDTVREIQGLRYHMNASEILAALNAMLITLTPELI